MVALHKSSKAHPRQWVEDSNDFYVKTKGNLGIPPTAVGGLFKSQEGI
jgi:hypothetical protein